MMECNREEAIRARRIALKKLEKRDFSGAQRVALQAQRLCPELENLSQLLTVCKVYCAAEAKINRQLDWYGILQVQVKADDTVIRKQYDELAFWLHPNKNTLPGAEAAFKLVSEARMILSDHVKRSRYDIKRQTAGLSDITLGKRSGARHIQPYDCAIVFWTVCPHCQKRFVYYQRNFLLICDDCGKNFFAFKLSEQAVPSRFLSVAPDNSQVSLKMVSCQLRSVPDQLIQHTEVCSTGGSMDSEPIVDSTCTEEHITWVGSSGVHGEGNSETRSNVFQCSVVNQSHTSSASADKGATGSMMLTSPASDVVVNHNFGREDTSTVLNAAGSCNLKMLGKRKHDDCSDRGHMRDSCINKRRSKDDSLSEANSTADNMYNDDVADANTQAAKHVSDTMESQGEGNITHEGSQQKNKEEATYIANQAHGDPGTAYECTGSIRNRDSCNNDRQRKDSSVADVNSTDDKVCSDNAAGGENQAAEPAPSTLDCQDEGNATLEGSQQKYKKDVTDIANQMHSNPMITYEECSDFLDFGRLRDVNRTAVNQVCAIYDDHDSMPRNYDKIHHVDASNNNVADANTQSAKHVRDTMDNQGEGNATHEDSQQKYKKEATDIANQTHDNPGIAYEYTGSIRSRDSCNNDKQRKGNSLANSNSTDDKLCSDNVAGDENQAAEPVPSNLDSQDEQNGTQEGSQQKYKMDVTDIGNQMDCDPVITYERSDFFDFETLRDVNRIAVNQIWAIYDNRDSMPRNYAQINHVDAYNNIVQLTWLEHNTTELQETRWTCKELAVTCGNFYLGETCVLQDASMYLSHKVSFVSGKNANSFEIHPKKGEIWALYKESSLLRSRDTDNHKSVAYDIVKVSDDSMSVGIIVSSLVRIEGFVSLFAESKDKSCILIPSSELHRFSHSIPCYRTNGSENVGVGGLLELDTAALPCDLATVSPSITLDSFIDLNKEKVSVSL